MLELIDARGEWYFDNTSRTLYLYHNGTGAPTPYVDATDLETIVSVMGTQHDPVRDVTFDGIQFVDAAASFMKPHGVPSSGDWALRRTAAVISEGVVNLTVKNCRFQKVDGNGLLLSGYNREVTIVDTEFVWIGGSAMVAWGSTDDVSHNGTLGFDATKGEFPRGTNVDHVTCREVRVPPLPRCRSPAGSCGSVWSAPAEFIAADATPIQTGGVV